MEAEIERYRRLMRDSEFSNIFVFGSNLSGAHGAGSAREARNRYGAIIGVGKGFAGHSYAIPTKGRSPKLPVLPLDEIRKYVDDFLVTARLDFEHRNALRYVVTRIGCGLAGYTDAQIAPMFKNAPGNCVLPDEWKEYL